MAPPRILPAIWTWRCWRASKTGPVPSAWPSQPSRPARHIASFAPPAPATGARPYWCWARPASSISSPPKPRRPLNGSLIRTSLKGSQRWLCQQPLIRCYSGCIRPSGRRSRPAYGRWSMPMQTSPTPPVGRRRSKPPNGWRAAGPCPTTAFWAFTRNANPQPQAGSGTGLRPCNALKRRLAPAARWPWPRPCQPPGKRCAARGWLCEKREVE
mmetsp:Transcript_18242/g.28773  ORF Transcript_18242/g.28773 Transcript_18242/m.28773 type:complete len:213 (+) Transcript_18242:114-752(+)